MILAHPGDVILPELGPKLGAYAQKKLAERKVEIRVKTKVVRVDEDVVDLSDGSRIPTKTVVWTAGTSANNFSGFLAWFLWRTVYLSKLPRFEKKVRVALDWTIDLLFSKDLVHLLDLRPPTVSQIKEETDAAFVASEH